MDQSYPNHGIGRFRISVTDSQQPAGQRDTLAELRKQLAALKPATTVPVLRELPEGKQRKTHIQLRGSDLSKGDEMA